MNTRKIIDPKQNGEKVWLKGHAQAIYMSDGSTVEDAINNIEIGTEDLLDYAKKSELSNVATSGDYNDLSNKPTIPSAITESIVSDWGFTKNTGTYSKPSTGIPKTDLDSSIQTSLGKADTALQSEQYQGTITGVSVYGTPVATSGIADIPAASTSEYGVTKLSSATDSTSTSLAATASAVKAAYDLANGKQDKVVSTGGTAKIDWNNDIDNAPGIRDEVAYIDFNKPINIAYGFFFDSENSAACGKLTFDNDGMHYEILGDNVLDAPATMDIIHTGDGTKFLADDGTYKGVYTKNEIDAKIGNINTILESIINGRTINNITFTIEGVEHQAEIGMTWKEWLETDYNTYGLFESTNGDYYIDAGDMQGIATYSLESVYFVGYSDDSKVKITDEIINNYSYKIIEV